MISPTHFSTPVHKLTFWCHSSDQVIACPYYKYILIVCHSQLYAWSPQVNSKIHSAESLSLTIFIIWGDLVVKKWFLAVNLCTHPHPNPCLLLFFSQIPPKIFDSPLFIPHPLSQGRLILHGNDPILYIFLHILCEDRLGSVFLYSYYRWCVFLYPL